MSDASIVEVRQRAAVFARKRWPANAEKLLQRELDISESTAERILAGAASDRSLRRMMRAWGWAFASFVLEPLCGSVDPGALHRRIEAAEEKARAALTEAGELKSQIAGGDDADLDRRAADRGRSVVPAPGEADHGAVALGERRERAR